MIRNGDNFRVMDGESAAWALGQFFATHATYPELGLPKRHEDHPLPQPPPRIPQVWTPEMREKQSKAMARYHSRRLGIRQSELEQYRNLRNVVHMTRTEAIAVIKNSRKPAR